MAAAVALAGLISFAAGGLRQFLCFLLRQLVQRFFYAASDQFLDLPLITSSFSCTSFSDMVCCLLSEWCVATSFYQSLQTMSIFSLFKFAQLIVPYL